MGWWQVDADTLARSRFVVSALAETTACWLALDRATAALPGERAWLDAHLPAYRAWLAREPLTALLIRTAVADRWIADFLSPTPQGDVPFETELARVAATPPDLARADLEIAAGGPLPGALAGADLGGLAADLLHRVWTRAVAPDWARRRRVLEAEVIARTGQVGRGGWTAAIEDMRPGMRWLGGARLQVNPYDVPPRDVGGADLLFVPVTPRLGWVSWDVPRRYAVVYPCSGVLAEPVASVPEGLGRLLGRARANVLIQVGEPKSTTQLVALTGQGLGSVGRHLRTLLDAGLVGRRRAGRSVLYYRTALGHALVAARAEDHGEDGPPRGTADRPGGPARGW